LNDDVLGIIRNSSFDRNALNREADRTGAGRVAVEKDFVISVLFMLMAGLPGFSDLAGKMVFRGGTCIKKVFYPQEGRFSEDLDFLGLNTDNLGLFLDAVDGLTKRDLGVTRFQKSEVEYRNERGLDFLIYYTSVLQQTNHITFNLSTASPIRPIRRLKVNVEPYFSESPTVCALDMSEILAEKTRALLQRRKPRDVFDVWFLIKKKGRRLDKELLRDKLQRSYDAAPFGKKKEAAAYVMADIVSKIRQSVTEKAWRNELGGLLMRPRPDRATVVDETSAILLDIGDMVLGKT